MRIERLELTRFGKFTDCAVELPEGKPDLHLIIGRNEAGKSTLRAAIVDLLFGIETRSAYNFMHAYRDMCLGAVVTSDAERLAFRRWKRERHSLCDADDQPLAEGRLAELLGPVNRLVFERMFALDRRKLEEGGVAILKAKDDLGRMLFEASAGLASLAPLRQKLEAEADALWGPRKKQSRAYYVALEKFDAASGRLRQVTVRAGAWQAAQRQSEVAQVALQAAIDEHQRLETTRARLDRIRRVAPHLRAHAERLAERAAIGEVARLPADAATRLEAAMATIAAQDMVIAQQQALIERADNERARIVVDQAVLGRREAIVRLGDERTRVRDHPIGIAKRQAELQQLRDDVAELVRQLGWPAASEEELARRMPSRPVRAEIQELLKRHAGLAEAETMRAETLAATRRELADLDRDLAATAERPIPAALTAARVQARTLGDVVARQSELAAACETAERRLAAALADLAPCRVDPVTLGRLQLPEPEAVQLQLQHEGEIDDRLRALRLEQQKTAGELEALRLREAQISRDRQPVTADAVAVARAARDALWGDIRDGGLAPGLAATDFEARVAHADDLADRRYLAAADVEQLEQLRAQAEQHALRQRQLAADLTAAAAERGRLDAAWHACLPAELRGLAAASLTGWGQRRRHALDAAEQAAAADAARRRFEAGVADAVRALQRALVVVGPGGVGAGGVGLGGAGPGFVGVGGVGIGGVAEAGGAASAGLPGLLAEADAVVGEAERLRTQRQELLRQRENLVRQLEEQETAANAAVAALAQWSRQWTEQLAASHLSPDLGTTAAQAALNIYNDLAQKLGKIDEIKRGRIATMRRDLDAYATAAVALAADLALDMTASKPDDITTALVHRLGEAEKAKERLDRATADRADAIKLADEARAAQQQAAAALQPLHARAGTTSVADLRAAIDHSAQAMAIDAAIGQLTQTIDDNGDGLSLADLTQEVATEDLATIGPRLAAIEAERAAVLAKREERLLAENAASRQLAAIDGASAAAEAEAERQEALAEMAAVSDRYITVFVAARLLRWATDRFRAEKQDPLLRRAGEIFRDLTEGSFEALGVDYDGDTPQLMGRRQGGHHVDVGGMSEGTRDQLYLALRLAALELHLGQSRPLPFIADDLFVNFDDGRAAAGLRALAELATKTQVIFLSHHQHLAEVARQAIGNTLSITTL